MLKGALLCKDYPDVAILLMVYNGDSKATDAMYGRADISYYATSVLERSAELERLRGK